MRQLLAIARGVATVTLTGLGLLVVLRGDGAATHLIVGSLLIAAGCTAGMIGVLLAVVDGRFPRDGQQAADRAQFSEPSRSQR